MMIVTGSSFSIRKLGGWDEIEGEVYYSLSDFTDEVLVEELKRRGYKVIK